MARDDGWRSEVTDLLLDAEHRDELRRVGVWAFEHVAKREATGQIAAVINAVAASAAMEYQWRAVDLDGASNDELRSLAIVATVLRGETEWHQVDGIAIAIAARADNSGSWSPEIRDVWSAVLDAVCAEQDRRLDSLDALNALWRLPAIAAEEDRRPLLQPSVSPR